ncbi:hypothetical protein H4Q26_001880 [Puccinia striiformis f. sp. tritici PST-130]|nr:hypothetical protein H4Q26_001880 [Puccinia striiformis f. sp. tritici PST-130]
MEVADPVYHLQMASNKTFKSARKQDRGVVKLSRYPEDDEEYMEDKKPKTEYWLNVVEFWAAASHSDKASISL